MPNPLFRVQRNTSKTNVKRPEPIEPVPEKVHGQNLPYRGINQEHGVEPNVPSEEPDAYMVDVTGSAKPVNIYMKPEKAVEPVPVKIVRDDNETGREYRQFWTDRYTVTDRPTQVFGRDDQRVTSRLLNTDAAKTVYIASNPADLSMRGYPLGPGKELTINGEMPVYAIAAVTGDSSILGVYVETVVPEQ